jgi:hypothetical protein
VTEENVELARSLYAGGATWDTILANRERIAPGAELDLSAVYPDAPVSRGFEQALRWAESGPWRKSVTLEAERFVEIDDERVLVLVRVRAKGRGSGVPVEMRDAHEITIRDGTFHRLKIHPDQQQALSRAGVA